MRTRAGLVSDIAGLLLMSVATIWIFASAAVSRSDPLAALLLLSMLLVGTVAGRLAPRILSIVVLASAALLLVSDPRSFIGGDGASYPFEYENAKGAFLVQAAAAGILVAGWKRSQRIRIPAIAGAIVFGVTPVLFGSLAAGILGLLLVGLSLGTAMIVTTMASRLLTWSLGGILLAMVIGTILLGSTYTSYNEPAIVGTAVDATLSERRRLLWGDAFDAMKTDPLFGVGPGTFERTSALARTEEDVRWVPSVFLEHGAEGGIPGLVLVTLIFLWGFTRLTIEPRPGWLVATGGAALFAIGVHAGMDFILHYPLVPLTAGVIFGSATSTAWSREE